MEMDRKKKGLLLLTVAGGVVVILLAILFIWSQSPSGRMGSGEERNVYIDVQNAEEKPLEESKIKSYRSGRSNIEDYWDEVGEELDARRDEVEDPVDIVSGRAQDGAGRSRPRTYTAEDVFGGAPSPARTQEPPASPSRPDAAERRAMYQKERQAAIDEVIRRQEERMRAEQEGGEDEAREHFRPEVVGDAEPRQLAALKQAGAAHRDIRDRGGGQQHGHDPGVEAHAPPLFDPARQEREQGRQADVEKEAFDFLHVSGFRLALCSSGEGAEDDGGVGVRVAGVRGAASIPRGAARAWFRRSGAGCREAPFRAAAPRRTGCGGRLARCRAPRCP